MHVFLSYPKSGRTWLRFMIDSYLCQHHGYATPNVFEIETKLKGTTGHIEWTHLTGAMIMQMPYWQMGRLELGQAKQLPWLLLVRNFHATLRSAYFQARDRVKVFSGTPSEFLRDPRYGVVKLVTFYNVWTEQVQGKLASSRVFAYEHVLADPVSQFADVLAALDLPVREDWVAQIVAESTPQRMKELGLTPAYASTPLAPADPNRPETFKVRDGAGNADLFSDEDLAYIDAVVDALFIAKDDPAFATCLGSQQRVAAA